MVWPFGKDEEKEDIPKLPELPPLPNFDTKVDFSPKSDKKLPALPTFPSSITGEKISNQAVKRAVKEYDEDSFENKTMTRELEDDDEIIPNFNPHPNYQNNIPQRTMPEKPISRNEPIFIRIDKYQESLANFQEVKTKILEIENMLKEIKEIKTKEEAELQEWEQEIQDAKAKLDRIDKTIFQKLEEY